MSQRVQLRGGLRAERSRYLAFLYIGGAFFLLLIVTSLILSNVYSSNPNDPKAHHIISYTVDNIVFQLCLAIGTTGFGSAVVGVIIDQYQRRFVEKQEQLVQFVQQEGILDVFRTATDPRLIQYMADIIKDARSEIRCVGLGLGILAHNRDLLIAIGKRLNDVRGLEVSIYLGATSNAGVNNRIDEEKNWHIQHNINYDATWVNRYPAEIQSQISSILLPNAVSRFHIISVKDCPMIAVIKIDDYLLAFPYGSPNIRGSQSPWLALDGKALSSDLVAFFLKVISFYKDTY